MSTDRDVVERLDRLIAVTKLVHADTIDRVSRDTRQDAVNAQILELTAEDWVAAGQLKDAVVAATGQSSRTVVRRLAELVGRGVVEQQGAGPSSRYRSTGLI